LPYTCGVMFFYHIPCTGGTTINNFLLDNSKERNGSASYFTYYGVRERTVEEKNNIERHFIDGMNKHVENISANEWKISHAHTNSLHLNESEGVLSNWRSTVESQGCHFIASVMFRDPLIHILAKHAYQHQQNIPRDEWISHLKVKDKLSPPGIENQIDFFLYNLVARNPYAVSTEVKVQRALELLVKHFNVVSVGGHDDFTEKLRSIAGWNKKEVPRLNTFPNSDKILFTKDEIKNLQALLKENGDLDFIENIRLIYGDYLLA